MAIHGPIPATDYCQLQAADIYLDGALNVSFTNGYVPQIGDHYVLLTYSNSRTGDYSPVFIAHMAGIHRDLSYIGKNLELLAQWAPRQLFIPIIIK